MSLSIAGHLKEKEREENKIATHVDPKKPRTEFKIDPDRELTNVSGCVSTNEFKKRLTNFPIKYVASPVSKVGQSRHHI